MYLTTKEKGQKSWFDFVAAHMMSALENCSGPEQHPAAWLSFIHPAHVAHVRPAQLCTEFVGTSEGSWGSAAGTASWGQLLPPGFCPSLLLCCSGPNATFSGCLCTFLLQPAHLFQVSHLKSCCWLSAFCPGGCKLRDVVECCIHHFSPWWNSEPLFS